MPELNSLNLFEYIKNGLFIKNIEKQEIYDVVLFEKFDNNEIAFENIKIETLENLNYDFGISGTIASYLEKFESMLLILDEFNIIYLLPIIQKLKNKNLTIINLGTGITSNINKQYLEDKDVGILLNFDIGIYEPYDLASFFDIIKLKKSKYIRISNQEGPINIFGEDKKDLGRGLVSLTDYELSGTHGTLVCPGYMLQHCIGALQDGGSFYDLFCFVDYNFELTEEFKASILKTEKIIMVLDQSPNSIYEKVFKSRLWELGLFDTEISFIYPSWNKLDTNMKDYIFGQVGFDAESIKSKL